MRLSRPLATLAVLALAFAGCSSSSTSSPSASPSDKAGAGTPAAAPKGLTIFYEENCQVELIAPTGRRRLRAWSQCRLPLQRKRTPRGASPSRLRRACAASAGRW